MGKRHVADFVEKKRAAIGLFEDAFLGPGSAGERAFFVAEELGLEQTLSQRAAIDGDEGAGFAPQLVQCLRDAFLADARFAGDQHGGRGAGDSRQHGFDLPHGRRQSECARKSTARRHEFLDLVDQRVEVEGLGDVVLRAFLEQAARRCRCRHDP